MLLSHLLTYRELMIAWTWRSVRARYQQSFLGGLWAVLQPAATAAIFTFIFTRILPVNTDNVPYVVFSYTALAPWTLLTTAITDMTSSMVANMHLITKIYFPREVLVFAALLARLVDFAVALLILFGLIIIYRAELTLEPALLLFLPLILLIQLLLMGGVGLFGAAVNVFYRDVKHIVALGLQLWLYLSPIIYPVARVPEALRPYYFLNPMAGILEAYRAVLLNGTLPNMTLAVAAIISLCVFLLGYGFFKRSEMSFADVI